MGVLASTVEPEAVSWAWQRRFPLGKLTMLDGDPGHGKSLVTVDIAARISSGRPMPDGTVGVSGGVVMLNAEDGIADTIVPRLKLAGADLDRALILNTVGHGDNERPLSLPEDMEELRQGIAAVGAVAVFIDPLMAFLSGAVDSHRDQDVRRTLAQLARLAEETHVAVVLVRHLNKMTGTNPLYRGGGSIGIVGASRAAYLVASDPGDATLEVLACTKNNLAMTPQSIGFRVVEVDDVGSIKWEGLVNRTASDLLAPAKRGNRRGRRGQILECLEEGLTSYLDVAEALNITPGNAKRTLNRMAGDEEVERVAPGQFRVAMVKPTPVVSFPACPSLSRCPAVPIVPGSGTPGTEETTETNRTNGTTEVPERWSDEQERRFRHLVASGRTHSEAGRRVLEESPDAQSKDQGWGPSQRTIAIDEGCTPATLDGRS